MSCGPAGPRARVAAAGRCLCAGATWPPAEPGRDRLRPSGSRHTQVTCPRLGRRRLERDAAEGAGGAGGFAGGPGPSERPDGGREQAGWGGTDTLTDVEAVSGPPPTLRSGF